MMCHKSKHKKGGIGLICAGYALVVGYDSVGLRIANFQGKFEPEDFSTGGIELHPDFKSMLRAQGIRIPLRNKLTDRQP